MQAAMQDLVLEHQNLKAMGSVLEHGCNSHQFYTSAVGFLSRDLPDPVEVKSLQSLAGRVQAEAQAAAS